MTSAVELPTVVMGSANPDKVAEIAMLLEGIVRIEPRPADLEDTVEDADTLEGNARLKAVAVCSHTGLAAVSDDTGLEIDALGGAPGVYTARFAGEGATYADNVAKTLSELDGLAVADRTARFRTVALLRNPDGSELVAHGVVEGHIAEQPSGEGGFGYDPIFVPNGTGGRTFAQMTSADKHAISHRGRAFAELRRLMSAAL